MYPNDVSFDMSQMNILSIDIETTETLISLMLKSIEEVFDDLRDLNASKSTLGVLVSKCVSISQNLL